MRKNIVVLSLLICTIVIGIVFLNRQTTYYSNLNDLSDSNIIYSIPKFNNSVEVLSASYHDDHFTTPHVEIKFRRQQFESTYILGGDFLIEAQYETIEYEGKLFTLYEINSKIKDSVFSGMYILKWSNRSNLTLTDTGTNLYNYLVLSDKKINSALDFIDSLEDTD